MYDCTRVIFPRLFHFSLLSVSCVDVRLCVFLFVFSFFFSFFFVFSLCWWVAVCEYVCVNRTKQREKFWDDIRRKWYYVRSNDDKLKCNGIFFRYSSYQQQTSCHCAHTRCTHNRIGWNGTMLNSKALFIRSLIRRGANDNKKILRNGMTITKSIKPNFKNTRKKTLTCTCSKFNFYQLIVYVKHTHNRI